MNIEKYIVEKIYLTQKEKDRREAYIIAAAFIGIIINMMLVIFKLIVGYTSKSIAIVSDAVNNLTDALSSLITIISSKLANKRPDETHPYGHGRIEYISSLIISTFILVLGWEFLKSSIQTIRNPKEVVFNLKAIIILLIAILAKIYLVRYNKKIGKKTNSPALLATAKDAYSDVLVSSITVISAFISIFTDLKVDGYIGVIVSVFILYSGVELIKDTLNSIIGEKIDKNLAKSIYEYVENYNDIQQAHDLILNNYGPNRYIGSMNLTFLDTISIKEVSVVTAKLQNDILKEFGIYIVFGLYIKNTKDKKVIKDEEKIRSIVLKFKEVEGVHAFYILYEQKFIRFDIVINYEVENSKDLVDRIKEEINKEYVDYEILINVDGKYV